MDLAVQCHNWALWLYSCGVNEAFFAEASEWLTRAGLAGTAEAEIVSGLCRRFLAAGFPLARALLFVDTLHPVHEGRLFRWGVRSHRVASVRLWPHRSR